MIETLKGIFEESFIFTTVPIPIVYVLDTILLQGSIWIAYRSILHTPS